MRSHPQATGRSSEDEPAKEIRRGTAGSRDRARWLVALGLLSFVLYLSNGRYIGTEDTEPAMLLAYTIARGEGVDLDRFRMLLKEPDGTLFGPIAESRGHLLSIYPIAPAVLAAPIEVPMFAFLDWDNPQWKLNPDVLVENLRLCSKVASALIVSAGVVLLAMVLLRSVSPVSTSLAVVAAGFGSGYWSTASQAAWQHGPAAVLLTATILLLQPGAGRRRIALAGLTTAGMVACRAIDVVFAAAILAWLARNRPRDLRWFLPGAVVLGSALIAYNLYYFGAIEGGQAIAESRHPRLHGVAGPWSGNLLGGASGTLFSPSRGLLVFCPWIALAMVGLPTAWRRLGPDSVVRWLLIALVPFGLILSKYAVWWGGHCFGPRYWIDVVPLFAILLGFSVDGERPALRRGLAVATIAWALALQGIGAYRYPSSWNLFPENVDLRHDRLWDWSDTEISRCLGFHARVDPPGKP